MKVKEVLSKKIDEQRIRIGNIMKNHGDKKVQDLTIAHIYRGMRGCKILTTDISYVDPDEGIRLRGYTLPECLEKLPKSDKSEIPLLGGLFYLLVTGDLPSKTDAVEIEQEWKKRSTIPSYVIDVLRAMPKDSLPITMLSAAVLSMQKESQFSRKYREGMPKTDYWEPTFEDSMDMLAKLPGIVANIFRMKYKGDTAPPASDIKDWDWAGNTGVMMGIEDKSYHELCKLYILLHSDHESGNVSAHAMHLVGSALSDPYYSWSAGLNGLAGPIHGGAVHEVLRWLLKIKEKFNGIPTEDQLASFVKETLASGQVVPGYGHAVLRNTDPRFTAQYEFGDKYLPNDDLFRIAKLTYKVVPPILKGVQKIQNPWPNVDALTGALQWHYGLREFDYYILLFGISRALGVTANAIWDRALGMAIERPKSITTEMVEKIIKG